MKKIGLIGGMSWESSLVYYEVMNKKVREILGGYHSSKCVIESVDFAEIEELQSKGDWNGLDRIMADMAINLEKSGAEIIILCTNTMHLCSDKIIENISVPFLHIVATTGKAIKEKHLNKIALLGTKFTMEKDFYKKILLNEFDIEVIIPKEKDRNFIHHTIYNELVHGKITKDSKKGFIKIINELKSRGAQGVILGCTEIPLLIKQTDIDIPVFDTSKIHAESAVELALKDL